MNRSLPAGDRGCRIRTSRRPQGHSRTMLGAFRLVGGTAEDREKRLNVVTVRGARFAGSQVPLRCHGRNVGRLWRDRPEGTAGEKRAGGVRW